jgi:hypothetical protein
MAQIWSGASRQWELLDGLVDLRLGPTRDNDGGRGTKRQADVEEFMIPIHHPSLPSQPSSSHFQQQQQNYPPQFHSEERPLHPIRRNINQSSTSTQKMQEEMLKQQQQQQRQQQQQHNISHDVPSSVNFTTPVSPSQFSPSRHINSVPSDAIFAAYMPSSSLDDGGIHNSFDVLNYRDLPQLSSEFRARSGTSTPMGTNYSDLLDMIMSGGPAVSSNFGAISGQQFSQSMHLHPEQQQQHQHQHQQQQQQQQQQHQQQPFGTGSAFSNFPRGVDISIHSEWRNYLPQAFFSPGTTPHDPTDNSNTGHEINMQEASKIANPLAFEM